MGLIILAHIKATGSPLTACGDDNYSYKNSYFKNKELISTIDSERGDFSKLLPDDYENLLYSNKEYSDIIILKGDNENDDFPFG